MRRPPARTGPRLEGHGLQRGTPVTVLIDGVARTAYLGESVAAAVMSDGELELRTTTDGSPRGVFCGMGVCFDCLVVVDGVPNTRACVTWVKDGMVIDRQVGRGATYREAAGSPGPDHG